MAPRRLRQQALSDALPDLYARAVVDTEVDPIAAPEIDITSGEDGGPVTFDAVVEIRPTVSIAGYGGLRGDAAGIEVDRRGGRRPGRPSAGPVRRARPSVSRAGARRRPRHHRPARHAPATARTSTSRTTSTRWAAVRDVAGLDEQLRGAKTGRHPAVHGAACGRRTAREDEAHDPGAREGRQGEGPPRGHRRVGGRGVGVRHAGRAARRPAQPARARSRWSRPRWPCASAPSRRWSAWWPTTRPRRSSRPRCASASTTSVTASRRGT